MSASRLPSTGAFGVRVRPKQSTDGFNHMIESMGDDLYSKVLSCSSLQKIAWHCHIIGIN